MFRYDYYLLSQSQVYRRPQFESKLNRQTHKFGWIEKVKFSFFSHLLDNKEITEHLRASDSLNAVQSQRVHDGKADKRLRVQFECMDIKC